jgi:hypothetical protein
VNGRPVIALLLVTAAALAGGCSWVSLTPGGEKVRVLEPEEVGTCRLLGKTTATTSAAVAGIGRSFPKVLEELERLARNSAADMGGDTIVPEGRVEDGRRTFGVYRCVGAAPAMGSGAAVTRPLQP